MMFIPEQVSIINKLKEIKGSPVGSDSKESARKGRDPGFDPWVQKTP